MAQVMLEFEVAVTGSSLVKQEAGYIRIENIKKVAIRKHGETSIPIKTQRHTSRYLTATCAPTLALFFTSAILACRDCPSLRVLTLFST